MRCARTAFPSAKLRDDIRRKQFQCFPIILERAADPRLHTRVLISSNQVGDGGTVPAKPRNGSRASSCTRLAVSAASFRANSNPITTVFSIAP
jgi:hypothetical protein